LAGFELTTYGRFWVTAEGAQVHVRRTPAEAGKELDEQYERMKRTGKDDYGYPIG
jgi:hypothetical protein